VTRFRLSTEPNAFDGQIPKSATRGPASPAQAGPLVVPRPANGIGRATLPTLSQSHGARQMSGDESQLPPGDDHVRSFTFLRDARGGLLGAF
jgi:hypothetical protein